mgnify:FL=1
MEACRRNFFAVLVLALSLIGTESATAQERASVGGFVTSGANALCALVLINGQSQFSCDGAGRYDMDVPLDKNGMISVQAFADGFSPVNKVLTPEQAAEYPIEMFVAGQGVSFRVESTVEPGTSEKRAFISGTVGNGSVPVCALVLANGQKMFSCGENIGIFDLDVPLDGDGNITLMVFAAGFQPYKRIIGDSDSGPGPQASNNFTAVALESESPDPRIGYPLNLTLTIDAIESADDVPVTFYAFDPVNEAAKPFALDAWVIAEIITGRNDYEIVINVPSEVENPQSYFIGASIDPLDRFLETDEEDNQTSVELTLSAARSPNLFIEHIEPDRTTMVLDRSAWDYGAQIAKTGEINSDAGGTLRWGGHGIEERTEVEAFAILRLKRSDKPPSDILDIPLYLWNTDEQRYVYAYGVDPDTGSNTGVEEWLPIGRVEPPMGESATEFDIKSAHLDFYFPGRLGSELEIALRNLNVFLGPIVPPPDLSEEDIQALRTYLFGADLEVVISELCVSIRPADQSIVEDTTDDNSACTPLQFILPPLPEPPPPPPPIVVPPIYDKPVFPLYKNARYSTGWPGAFFGVSVDLVSSTAIDSNGIVVSGLAEIPVTLFGVRMQFAGIEARAQMIPDSNGFAEAVTSSDPGLSLDILAFDKVIYTTDRPPESTGEISLSYSIEVPDPEQLGFCCNLGPVPVNYKASVSGSVGVSGELEFESESNSESFVYKTTFFESAEASFQAFANFVVARIGGDAVATLIENSFPIENRSTINILDDRHSNGTSEVEIISQYLVKNEISGPEGSINAFVEVGAGEKCDWGIFSFVCKALPNFRYEKSILEWAPFKKLDFTIVNDVDVIDVVTLPDGTVVYYGE